MTRSTALLATLLLSIVGCDCIVPAREADIDPRDFDTRLAAWRENPLDLDFTERQAFFRRMGQCDEILFLAEGDGLGSQRTFYDASTRLPIGINVGTEFLFPCFLSWWPRVIDCPDPVVTEVIVQVGEVVDAP